MRYPSNRQLPSATDASAQPPGLRPAWPRRLGLTVAALALAVGLTGCGGGLDLVIATPFNIAVAIGGQPVSGVVIAPGAVQTVYLPVGQSIEFDASEPVTWTLTVGGSAVTGTGVTVYYNNVAITQTALTPSRILIDTTYYPLSYPFTVTLVATSTIDFAQVATIDVVLTN